MAVAMFMRWPGITSDQYDSIMSRLELDANPAAGEILHVASLTEEGLEVCEVWQTEQAAHSFLERRLLPIARELGVKTDPDLRVMALRNLYAADPDMIDRIGAVALPGMVAEWAR
ncbi:MAG: hypothetical protein R6W48_09825 [Gaiellaceae bacterium]